MPTITLDRIHNRQRSSARNRGHMIFMVRTQPERFQPHIVEIVQQAREDAITAIGDVYDWDCHDCQNAVITPKLSDNCPRCGGTGYTLGRQ